MESSSVSDTAAETIKFRAGKKRKAYRQRIDEDQDAPTSNPLPQTTSAPDTQTDHDDDSSVAAALKLRNARKSRLRGVGFTTTSRADETSSTALIPHTHDDVELPNIANRFTHQTGMLADLNDKHMMAYIESRLSNRAAPASPSTAHQQQHQQVQEQEPDVSASTSAAAPPKKEGQDFLKGHLVEIDLSHEAEPVREETKGKRRRLGRDGKPWRPRNRRGSDAIKRDQLVDEILRENRLDVYQVPAQPSNTGPDEDGAADERLAEEFRRQFLDDVADRQMKQQKKVAQPVRQGAEDVLKGPKLGGSRNARAAMRDMLLKKEKDIKK